MNARDDPLAIHVIKRLNGRFQLKNSGSILRLFWDSKLIISCCCLYSLPLNWGPQSPNSNLLPGKLGGGVSATYNYNPESMTRNYYYCGSF